MALFASSIPSEGWKREVGEVMLYPKAAVQSCNLVCCDDFFQEIIFSFSVTH